MGSRTCADELGELNVSADSARRDSCFSGYRFIKRAFDIAFSVCVLVVGFIPCVLLSVAVVVDTQGSPLYSQERIGRNGKRIRIYKFRSMVVDSDDVEKYFTPEQLAAWNRERKVEDDPRTTKLGKVLRRTSLDEIPQFVNVLFGHLSVIGPRAITEHELRSHFSDEEKIRLLSVSPGITGLWQCGPRNSATFESGDRQKIELEYVDKASLCLDARIFFRTFKVMFLDRTGR